MPSQTAAPELELRDYFSVLRRRKKAVLLSVFVAVAAALLTSYAQTPVYQASATVLLQPKSSESPFDPNTGLRLDPERTVATEILILESEPVQAAVREQIGPAPGASAVALGKTDVIAVRVEDIDPKRAATAANAYANSYIDHKRTQAIDGLFKAAEGIQAKIDELQKQINTTEGPQKASLISQQSVFKTKFDQLQVDSALKTGGAQLATPASPPTTPIRPKPIRSGVLALVVGLFLGVGLAFLRDYLDDSIQSKEDFERAAPGVGVIGLIPLVPDWKSKERPRVVSLTEPTSAAAEAYRTLRTAVQFLSLEQPMRVLQVTSPSAQEGKTTTLANLAVALAGADLRVVIVCCDLRRPRIHEFFGLDNEVGFTSVLLGKVGVTQSLQPVPTQKGLSLMASGPPPPNPSELLSSRRTLEVLTSLQSHADIVLVDSPPVLPVTDALVLSGRVDATLLVGVAGTTTRREAGRATELLRQVDAPLVGAILNGIDSDAAYGYAYQYYRSPGMESDAAAPASKPS